MAGKIFFHFLTLTTVLEFVLSVKFLLRENNVVKPHSQNLVFLAENDANSKPFSDHLEAPGIGPDAPFSVPGVYFFAERNKLESV